MFIVIKKIKNKKNLRAGESQLNQIIRRRKAVLGFNSMSNPKPITIRVLYGSTKKKKKNWPDKMVQTKSEIIILPPYYAKSKCSSLS